MRSALAAKLRNLRVLGVTKHSVWDALVFSKAKKAMGLNRVRLMISGGAPLPAKTMEVSASFCC
jgi:long-subunit acyl-CoA synthetase (AMP-forming)